LPSLWKGGVEVEESGRGGEKIREEEMRERGEGEGGAGELDVDIFLPEEEEEEEGARSAHLANRSESQIAVFVSI
jgi:hypothetical protein